MKGKTSKSLGNIFFSLFFFLFFLAFCLASYSFLFFFYPQKLTQKKLRPESCTSVCRRIAKAVVRKTQKNMRKYGLEAYQNKLSNKCKITRNGGRTVEKPEIYCAAPVP
ncbi:hypothetical protein BRADI_4g17228v3 [Brachypodium distachyon]|uniref:Uncharacterized protein n=1 Tax=Brachypodium distachyon TaxID=15368 RepID=A0A2K2CNC8_BRADI|nr:hypothetical protein BRADI_4g17228v3 [Brachypodium distachyon]